ncbi:hypothetical protein DPMN_147038 [Dreissena polymorpha]|uniref:Uncharacterized protein n=1 Tax=Dreissena polymorpha TaxID=45954 RepID=A0A9D4F704_DREPO|nr:hypothetical protein DPMN_147038 [Dreissena polymorpha]
MSALEKAFLDFREEHAGRLVTYFSKQKQASNGHKLAGHVNKGNMGPYIRILPEKWRRFKYHSLVLKERTDTCYGWTTFMTPLCDNGGHNLRHDMTVSATN